MRAAAGALRRSTMKSRYRTRSRTCSAVPGAAGPPGERLPLVQRLRQVVVDVRPGIGEGPQVPVQLVRFRSEFGSYRRRVGVHRVVQPGTGEAVVVADETDRVFGVLDVVGAYPLEQVAVLGVVPPPTGSPELLVRDPLQVALAAQEAGVEPQSGAPRRFQGEGPEALLLDQVPQDALLDGEELVRAVGGLAQAHHRGVTDHPAERAKVGQTAVGLGGAQRAGRPAEGRLGGAERRGRGLLRARRRGGVGGGGEHRHGRRPRSPRRLRRSPGGPRRNTARDDRRLLSADCRKVPLSRCGGR